MQAVWNYASCRKGDTCIMINGTLKDCVIMARWFSKHNVVKAKQAPEEFNGEYQIYMTFDGARVFVSPKPSEEPYDLVDLDDVFATFPQC